MEPGLTETRHRTSTSGVRDLVRQALRFGTVGLWATGVYLLVVAVVAAGGAPPQLSNAAGYGVATAVSFLGHFYWTFGKRSNHARALVRFLVIAGGGFLLSALVMHAAMIWLRMPFWVALASVVALVPGLSWASSRYWAFK